MPHESTAQEIIERHRKLADKRVTWETHWDEVARFCLPEKDDFRRKRMVGEKRQEFIFDSTATLAIRRLASIIDSLVTPLNQRWHGLRSPDPDLNKVPAVRRFFEEATDTLFRLRYRPAANFAGQNWERWESLSCFGTGSLFIDDMLGSGPNYKSLHLQETYFMENAVGKLDTVYRKYKLTAKQAAETFGEEELPEKIRKALGDDKDSGKEFEFIHAVVPNPDHDPNRLTVDAMKYRSWHVAVDDRVVLRESGFTSFPYSASRFSTSPHEIYGRSPAIEMLPQIKLLHEEKKTQITAGHMRIHPTTLLRDDGVITAVDLRPGGIIVGGLDQDGKRAMEPFINGADIQLSFDMQQADRKMVESAFFLDLFEILLETPQMTATEFLGRAQEKGILMTPTIGRQMGEALGPMIEREIDILQQGGFLPEPPGELTEAGGDYEVEYTSPLARAQKTDEAVGSSRTVQAAMEVSAVDPTVLDNIDFDQYILIINEANGGREVLLKDPELVAQIREQRQQQEQAIALAQNAPNVARAALDGARAEKTTAETANV